MNNEILKKYDIRFLKNATSKFTDGESALSSYLYIWREIDDANDFLADIELALTGQYALIADPDYSDGLLQIYGKITPDSLVLTAKGGKNPSSIPLSDFKQILLSWREFLTT